MNPRAIMWTIVAAANYAVAHHAEGWYQEIGMLCTGFALAQALAEEKR